MRALFVRQHVCLPAAIWISFTWLQFLCSPKTTGHASYHRRATCTAFAGHVSLPWDDILAAYWGISVALAAIGLMSEHNKAALVGLLFHVATFATFVAAAKLSRQLDQQHKASEALGAELGAAAAAATATGAAIHGEATPQTVARDTAQFSQPFGSQSQAGAGAGAKQLDPEAAAMNPQHSLALGLPPRAQAGLPHQLAAGPESSAAALVAAAFSTPLTWPAPELQDPAAQPGQSAPAASPSGPVQSHDSLI